MKRAAAQHLGESNKLLVLNQLRRRRVASVDQLVRATGRSQPTVLKWLGSLEREGLVKRDGIGESRGGRPPLLYRYHASSGSMLGIAVEIPTVTLALLDLDGRPIANRRLSIARNQRGNAVQAELLDGAERFLADAGEAGERVLRAGIAFSGFIDRDAGLSLATPRLHDWQDVPIRAAFESRLGRPVVLNHHIDALTLAELHYGATREARDFLFFDLGYGLGVRAVRDGLPLLGRFGNAGLMGHTTVVPDGRPCLCGNHGCLEEYVSGRALLRHASFDTSTQDEDGEIARTAVRLFDGVSNGDPDAIAVMATLERYLVIGLANAINIFEQPRVVLSGFATLGGDAFGRSLVRLTRALLQPTLAAATDIIFSRLPRAESAAHGAALFALQRHLPFADPLVVHAPEEGRSPTFTAATATRESTTTRSRP